MVRCKECGIEIGLFFTCKRCNEAFCKKHRLPELHHCPNLFMKKEDIALNTYLKKEGSSMSFPVLKESPRIKEKINTMEFEDEDEPKKRESNAGGELLGINLMMSLIVFFFFIAIDVGYLFSPIPNRFLLAIPLIIHAIFLPRLVGIARKQKLKTITPEDTITFVDFVLKYTIIYMIVRVIVSLLIYDFIMIFLLLFIGVRLILTWWQLSKIFKVLPR